MEGAQAFKILARSGQGKIIGHDLSDVRALLDLVDHLLRNQTVPHLRKRFCLAVMLRSERSTLTGSD